MDSTSLEDLSAHFCSKIKHIETLLQLRHVTKIEDFHELLSAVNRSIYDLQTSVSRMKLILSNDREQLSEFEKLKSTLTTINNRATYASERIPTRLPKVQKLQSSQPKSTKSDAVPLQQKQTLAQVPVVETKKASASSVDKEEENTPSIEYLTVDEFESVPKYMKGRMTYGKMNSVIDELNQVFNAKYKLLRQRRSSMTEKQKAQARSYKAQETKDTKGVHFIVEDDIKNNCNIKLDKASKTLFTILRHCQRLREVRGAKLLRYALCEYSY